MRTSYSPSYLVQTEVTKQEAKIAAAHNMTREELCRKAIAFFAAQCVHTQGSPRRTRRNK